MYRKTPRVAEWCSLLKNPPEEVIRERERCHSLSTQKCKQRGLSIPFFSYSFIVFQRVSSGYLLYYARWFWREAEGSIWSRCAEVEREPDKGSVCVGKHHIRKEGDAMNMYENK